MANEFLPFATAGGANVLSQAAWNALPARLAGYVAGVAESQQLNKTWRQSSIVAAMIGQYISDHSLADALDNGNITQLLERFEAAIRRQDMSYFPSPGGTADAITLTLDPAPTSWAELIGVPLRVVFAVANTTATPTLNVNGLGARTIVNLQGGTLAAGDLRGIRELTYDGANVRIAGLAASSAGRLIGIQTFISSGTYTPTPGMTFCIVEGCGGGGAGGGGTNPSAGSVSLGAPGGAATWGRSRFTAASIGASKSVLIGAGGVAVSGAAGGNGGNTDLVTLMFMPGGIGGGPLNNQVPPTVNGNGNNSPAGLGLNILSRVGGVQSISLAVSATIGVGAAGGDAPLGAGGFAKSANNVGAPAFGNGAGGAGVCITAGGGSLAGGNGSPGILVILEYGI